MMADPKYDGLLFGDISAIIAFRRVGRYTKELLEATHIHHRLVYGSDYPVSAHGSVNIRDSHIVVGTLCKHGGTYVETC